MFHTWLLLAAALFTLGCASSGELPPGAVQPEVRPSPEAAEAPLPELGPGATVEDYVRFAELNNEGLKAAFHRWRAALEKVPQQESLPDPRLSYTYYVRAVETRVGPQRQRVGLAQMFPWFGKLRLRGGVALEEANALAEVLEMKRLALRAQVMDAFYELAYLSQAVRITAENKDLLAQFERIARIRYETGQASNQDLIRAQVELGKLANDLLTLEDLRQPLVARLNSLLSRPAQTPLAALPEVEPTPVELDGGRLIELAMGNNPELLSFDYRIRSSQQRVELAHKEYFPDLTLGVDYIDTGRREDVPRPSVIADDGKDPVMVMLSVNVPIWYGRLNAGVREAAEEKEQRVRDRDDLANRLAAEIELAAYKVRDFWRQYRLYQDGLIPKGRQALRVSQADYTDGRADFLNLIDSQRALLQFRLAAARALASHQQQLARLEQLVGLSVARIGNGVEEDG